jgi:beta-glucanase (GH16 family)
MAVRFQIPRSRSTPPTLMKIPPVRLGAPKLSRKLTFAVLGLLSVSAGHAEDIIKDNADANGVALTGSWTVWTSSNGAPGYYGSNYLSDGNTGGGKSVRFTPDIPTAGLYQVSARWVAHANRATNAPITITHASGTTTVAVNQQTNGGKWMPIGAYYFNAGSTGNILVSNSGANGVVIADAIRLESGLIKDNADSSGISVVGTWTTGTAPSGFHGSNFLNDGGTGSGKSVRFTPTLPTSGLHQVFIRWPQSGTTRASSIPVDIIHASGTRTVQVDQEVNDSAWAPLGTYFFNSGTTGSIRIRNDGAVGTVAADAVKFVTGDAPACANVLVRDTFVDGARTNGEETADLAWYSIRVPGSGLSVVNDNGAGGIGGDNALKITPTSWSQGFVGNLPNAVTLADGESLILNFKWRYTGTTNTNHPQRVRFGFFNAGGSLTSSDAHTTVRNNDFGYWAGANPYAASGTGTVLMQEAAGDEILSGTGLTSIGTPGASVAGGTTAHSGMLKISRSGTTLVLSASIDEQTAATATVTNPSTYTFHEVAFAMGVGNPSTPSIPSPLIVDEIHVDRTGPPPGNWTLWLDEEFTGTALNTQIWSTGYRTGDTINGEYQAFRPENVSVANGAATIKVERRPGSQNVDMGGNASGNFNYASGAIQSYNKWAQKYGYFEARLRIPNAVGTWPAFWTLPDRGTTQTYNLGRRVTAGNTYNSQPIPMGNEHDILETFSVWRIANHFRTHVGYIWRHSSTGHQGVGEYGLANNGAGPEEFYYQNADTEFHTYGMYWGPNNVVFYVDGTEVLRRDNPVNNSIVPEYLILNVAIRGDCWLKHVTTAEIDADLATPKYMDIDYVKVWVDNTLPVPTEYIVDNSNGVNMTWTPSSSAWDRLLTNKPGYWWQNFAHDQNTGKGTKAARFTPDLFTGGNYEVFAWWPTGGSAANVPIDIIHASGTTTVTANQNTSGGSWYSLGTYTFNSGTAGSVTVRNAGTTNYVFADAVRFLKSSQEFQGEHFTSQSGTALQSSQSGFTGVGYLTLAGLGASVEWNNVNQAAGVKTLTFRYANGSATNRPCEVRVNGNLIGTVSFAPTGAWNTWATTNLSSVVMIDGLNTVTVSATTANGGPNLDKLDIQ